MPTIHTDLAGLAAGVEPFSPRVPEEDIEDLRSRLRRTRLPEPETTARDEGGMDWTQGLPRAYAAELVAAWIEYDWRRLEAELDRHGQFRTVVDGLGIHFLHRRSSRADALPLLLTHGWPGSVVEFLDVIDALVEPPPGRPAFHVVVPSLPGFGWSERPRTPGWGVARTADAWAELMDRLGYDRVIAHGGDWGAMVSSALAARHPERVALLHTTMPLVAPPTEPGELSAVEAEWLEHGKRFSRAETGYQAIQGTKPQTLGYGLTDSPVGQLAWITEKFHGWTDSADRPETAVARHRILDTVSLYWFSATAGSSARLYWEAFAAGVDLTTPVPVPTAVSYFAAEMSKLPRAWVETRYTDLRSWHVLDRGGHFPALEVPDLLVDEVRAAVTDAAAPSTEPGRGPDLTVEPRRTRSPARGNNRLQP